MLRNTVLASVLLLAALACTSDPAPGVQSGGGGGGGGGANGFACADPAQKNIDCQAVLAVAQGEAGKPVADKDTLVLTVSDLAIGNNKDVVFSLSNTASALAAAPLLIENMRLSDAAVSADAAVPPAFSLLAWDDTNDKVSESAIDAAYKFLPIVPDGAGGPNHLTLQKFVVRFTRLDTANRAAVLKFSVKNDPKHAEFTIYLNSKPGKAKIVINPVQLQFPYTQVNKSKSLDCTVTNVGDAQLIINSITFSGDATFSVQQQACPAVGVKQEHLGELAANVAIEPGASHAFCVTFVPTSDKMQTANLIFHSSDLANPDAGCKLVANSDVPCIKLSASKLDFGAGMIGAPVAKKITVLNCGGADLIVDGIALLASSPSKDFTFDFKEMIAGAKGQCAKVDAKSGPSKANPCTLPVGGQSEFSVIYTPTALSKKDAKGNPLLDLAVAQVSSNASIKPDVQLSGYGVNSMCPTAIASDKEGEEVIPQTTVHLFGAASKGAGSATVKNYKWTSTQPVGSNQKFMPNEFAADPTIALNAAGSYQFCLDVTDSAGVKSCAPACVSVLVQPNNAIDVELLWDTPADLDQNDTGPTAGADLDLHFANPLAAGPDLDCDGAGDPWFNGTFDAFWFDAAPNWGSANSKTDDPFLALDDVDGAGPENLNIEQPQGDASNPFAYSVGVHYWNAHGFGKSFATVSIYVQSVLVEKIEKVPMNPLDMWYVGKVNWPNQVGGGSLPPVNLCHQSGDACIGLKEPNNPKGGKMWKATGVNCITPCYVPKGLFGTNMGAKPATCK